MIQKSSVYFLLHVDVSNGANQAKVEHRDIIFKNGIIILTFCIGIECLVEYLVVNDLRRELYLVDDASRLFFIELSKMFCVKLVPDIINLLLHVVNYFQSLSIFS